MMELAIMGISSTHPKSTHTQFSEKITSTENNEEKSNALLNNPGGK